MLNLFFNNGNLILPHLDHILKSFYYTTEINITSLDKDGSIICDFPQNHSNSLNIKLDYTCINEYIKSNCSIETMENKESILFNHWDKFFFVCAPFYFKEEYKGALVAGPIFLNSWNISDIDYIIETFKLKSCEKPKLIEIFKSIPIKEPPRNFYLGQLLYHLMYKSIYIGSQQSARRDMSKSFIGQDFKYNEFENKIRDNNYIITNQVVEKVVLGDVENALTLYRKGLTIQNIPNLNNLSSHTSIKYMLINLCMVISHELFKFHVFEQEIVNTKYHLLMEINKITNIDNLLLYGETIIISFCKLIKETNFKCKSPVIKKALSYIDETYMEKLTLKQISKTLNINPSYFSSLFKNETGLSFCQYVNSVRIKYGQYLLKNTNKSIQNIALDVGYENQYYFSKVFKKFTNMCPNAYRNLNTNL